MKSILFDNVILIFLGSICVYYDKELFSFISILILFIMLLSIARLKQDDECW